MKIYIIRHIAWNVAEKSRKWTTTNALNAYNIDKVDGAFFLSRAFVSSGYSEWESVGNYNRLKDAKDAANEDFRFWLVRGYLKEVKGNG